MNPRWTRFPFLHYQRTRIHYISSIHSINSPKYADTHTRKEFAENCAGKQCAFLSVALASFAFIYWSETADANMDGCTAFSAAQKMRCEELRQLYRTDATTSPTHLRRPMFQLFSAFACTLKLSLTQLSLPQSPSFSHFFLLSSCFRIKIRVSAMCSATHWHALTPTSEEDIYTGAHQKPKIIRAKAGIWLGWGLITYPR